MSIVKSVKRGDTIIEVMFAFAIFSAVAIITASTMSLGVNSSEESLELVVARNELNAQAEALRFIHSSYISELTLPETCTTGDPTEKCQQYRELWDQLTSDYHTMVSGASITAPNQLTIEYPLLSCSTAYDMSSSNSLVRNRAFVLNTRQILNPNSTTYNTTDAIIRASNSSQNLFFPAPLNARIIYSTDTGNNGGDGDANSSQGVHSLTDYTRIARVEGIWVIAVRGPLIGVRPQYYDFYIQTCWYGPGAKAPTSLDTIVRLYNPKDN